MLINCATEHYKHLFDNSFVSTLSPKIVYIQYVYVQDNSFSGVSCYKQMSQKQIKYSVSERFVNRFGINILWLYRYIQKCSYHVEENPPIQTTLHFF